MPATCGFWCASGLKAGDSDAQVLDFLSARYGQFVLLKPHFGWDTALLWFAPVAVLLLGGIALVRLLRHRRRIESPDEQPLSEAEHGRLAGLLREGEISAPTFTERPKSR